MTTAPQPVVVEPPVRRGTAAVVGLGVALLAAATAVSAAYAREDGDLDWSNYGVGLGATGVLLLVMLAGSIGSDPAAKRALTGFPGAVGALAAGLLVGVGFDDESWVAWAIGGVILGVSVVAFLLGRAGAPTVTAVVGLAVLYGKAVDEVVDPSEENTLVVGGAVVLVFTVAVTVVGWALPHRALIGVLTGAGAVLGLVGLLATATLARSLMTSFSVDGTASEPTGPGDLENDVYIFFAYTVALVLLWTLAAWATGSSGFRVLAVVLAATMLPLGMVILAVEHPTWWGVGVGAAGTALVLLAVLGVLRGRRTPPAAAGRTHSTPPPAPSPPPPGTPASGTPATPAGKSDQTVIAPASTPPPPPDPQDRRPS